MWTNACPWPVVRSIFRTDSFFTLTGNIVDTRADIDKEEELHGRSAAAGRVIARSGIHDSERGTYRYERAKGPDDRPLLLPQGRHPGLHKGSVRFQGPHGRIREGGYTGLRHLARLSRISP